MSGAQVKGSDEVFCTSCGAVIKKEAEICPNCGVRQKLPPNIGAYNVTPSSGKSKLTAGLLGIFLGGIGVHKFYMGKTIQGVVYLLFCWTFIPAILGFIEGIIYITESDVAFENRLK